MRKYLLLFFILLFAATLSVFAQSGNDRLVTGKILDGQTKDPLIGATITVKGTKQSIAAGLDGSFKLRVPSSANTLLLTYVGYISKEVEINGNNIGVILMDANSAAIKEVNVNANPSLAINRQTPIAVSSVNATYIEEKGAGAEFPELLKMTPGVTVTRNGGGYGDSRINIRGFSSNNVALLINGIPVNDVEAGKIYWSDWSGLQDVTTSFQEQRGLGASATAVPSLGGTINISTRSTEKEAGGTILESLGSYGLSKTSISYATGLSDNGWATSFLLSKVQGTAPAAEGLYYTGYNYFANISKILSANQTLSFNFMGATQNHAQRYTYNTIATYRSAPQGTRYDSDWGYLNGQMFSAEQNNYNKPLASIDYNWKINSTTSWSTTAYATWGVGNADYLSSNKSGISVVLTPGAANGVPRTGNIYSPIDFNQIVKNNVAVTDGSANMFMQDVENNHQQYGILSSFKKKVNNISFTGGIDLRSYTGEHFNTVADLLGSSYVQDNRTSTTGDINNPLVHATTGQKFNNDYTYQVLSEGLYGQAEYLKDDFSAVVTLAASNTSNRRTDYFDYLATDPNRQTKWLNFLGYQAKGGANYNIDNQSSIYGNIGYIQRAPLVGTLFLNKNNTINPSAKPEKLFDAEIGYRFQSSMFTINVNAYHSVYLDRAKVYTSSVANSDGSFNTINLSGLNELHQGVEADAKFRPVKGVTLGGMISVGDYHYLSNTASGQITSQSGTITNVPQLYLKGLKIGEIGTSATSSQLTSGGTIDIKVLPKVTVGADYLWYSHYFASYDPTNITFTGYQLINIPDHGTLDANIAFRFKMAGFDAVLTANVYNALNTTYLGDAYDTTPSSAAYIQRVNQLGVYYGAPRYYVTALKIKF